MFDFITPGTLYPFVVLDVFCLLIAIALNRKYLALAHPLSIYLLFHFYSFTWRCWSLAGGASVMYEGQSGADPVCYVEYARAMFWADVGLMLFSLGALIACKKVEIQGRAYLVEDRPINYEMAKLIFLICLIIGGFTFILFRFSGGDAGDDGLRNYILASTMWPGTCILGFILLRGSIGLWGIPLAAYFAVVGLQGYHRFMLILPAFSLMMIWLYTKKRKWPPIALTCVLILGAVIFPYLKYIGRAVQERDTQYAIEIVKSSVGMSNAMEFESSNEQFLDQFAGFLTMADEYGKFEWGRSYLSIVTLPVPRVWWPDKPGLGDHTIVRATSGRDYAKEGRIITYLGESYVNFRELGLIVIPFLFGFYVTRFYARAFLPETLVLNQLVYLIAAPALIQAFRDGLPSAVLFGFVFNMPLIFIGVIQLFTSQKQRVRGRVA